MPKRRKINGKRQEKWAGIWMTCREGELRLCSRCDKFWMVYEPRMECCDAYMHAELDECCHVHDHKATKPTSSIERKKRKKIKATDWA